MKRVAQSELGARFGANFDLSAAFPLPTFLAFPLALLIALAALIVVTRRALDGTHLALAAFLLDLWLCLFATHIRHLAQNFRLAGALAGLRVLWFDTHAALNARHLAHGVVVVGVAVRHLLLLDLACLASFLAWIGIVVLGR